jgi:hypothetical protein
MAPRLDPSCNVHDRIATSGVATAKAKLKSSPLAIPASLQKKLSEQYVPALRYDGRVIFTRPHCICGIEGMQFPERSGKSLPDLRTADPVTAFARKPPKSQRTFRAAHLRNVF